MNVKHLFANEEMSITLFRYTKSFTQFRKKLIRLGGILQREKPMIWGRKTDFNENKKIILGNGFELFCELLILHMGFCPIIGLTDYRPVDESEDNGIDAFAYNINGELSAIQCKFVSNPLKELTVNDYHLSNFIVEVDKNCIDWMEKKTPKKAFIFTSGKGLHYTAVNKFNNRISVISNNIIKRLVFNNIIFWESCASILESD